MAPPRSRSARSATPACTRHSATWRRRSAPWCAASRSRPCRVSPRCRISPRAPRPCPAAGPRSPKAPSRSYCCRSPRARARFVTPWPATAPSSATSSARRPAPRPARSSACWPARDGWTGRWSARGSASQARTSGPRPPSQTLAPCHTCRRWSSRPGGTAGAAGCAARPGARHDCRAGESPGAGGTGRLVAGRAPGRRARRACAGRIPDGRVTRRGFPAGRAGGGGTAGRGEAREGKGVVRGRRPRRGRPADPAGRGGDRRRRRGDLGVQPGPPGRPAARRRRRRDRGLRGAADGGGAALVRARRAGAAAGRPGALRRPHAVGGGPGAARPVRRAWPRHRDRARRLQLHRGGGADRQGTHDPRDGPVGDLDPARRRQDPDAARRAGRGLRQARHHDGPLPFRGPVRPARRRAAVRRLPAGHPVRHRVPGELARRADRPLPAGTARRDHEGAQALEAHARARGSRARRGRHPLAPVPPGPLPRLPQGRRPRAARAARRGLPRPRRAAGGACGAVVPGHRPGRPRSPAGRRATGRRGAVKDPELREPDLPRTAKVRGRALRTGWTTGTCAAAAAKAAATALRTGLVQRSVEIALPSGRRVRFPVDSCVLSRDARKPPQAGTAGPAGPPGGEGGAGPGQRAGATVATAGTDVVKAEAVVVKDAGDDPDVTHGARLTATVSWRDAPGIELDGGVGVGVVTKPGLGLELGAPAINPVPRAMITQAVGEAVDLAARGVLVVISVPDGERMARKTTNARLGIIGGISILGTTGIVRPFSTASWRASVEQAVSVLAAQGETTFVFCTGGPTEKGAMALLPHLPEVCFVEVGDFTGAALRRAVEHGLARVVFVGMAGKLTKLAGGVLMTHYTRSRVPATLLGDITRAVGGSEDLAARADAANTARHAVELWESAGLLQAAAAQLCGRAAAVLARFCAEQARARTAGAARESRAAGDGGAAGTAAARPALPSVQGIMVDFTGRNRIAASGEIPPGHGRPA